VTGLIQFDQVGGNNLYNPTYQCPFCKSADILGGIQRFLHEVRCGIKNGNPLGRNYGDGYCGSPGKRGRNTVTPKGSQGFYPYTWDRVEALMRRPCRQSSEGAIQGYIARANPSPPPPYNLHQELRDLLLILNTWERLNFVA